MSCPRCGNSRVGIIIIIIIRIFKHKLLIFRTLHARTRVSLGGEKSCIVVYGSARSSEYEVHGSSLWLPLIFQLSINILILGDQVVSGI